MEQAIQLLHEVRRSIAITELRIRKFIELCETLKVPRVTIYSMSGYKRYEMQDAYVFTERKDAGSHIWIDTDRYGLIVYRYDMTGGPLHEWDPQADMITHRSLYKGTTNTDPFVR